MSFQAQGDAATQGVLGNDAYTRSLHVGMEALGKARGALNAMRDSATLAGDKASEGITKIKASLEKLPGGIDAAVAKAKTLGIDLGGALKGEGVAGFQALEKAFTAFKNATKDSPAKALTADQKAAAKAAEQHEKAITKLAESLGGAGAKKAADDLIEALKQMPPLANLSQANLQKVNKTAAEAITIFQELGETAPADLQAVYLETIKLLSVAGGAQWKAFFDAWEKDWQKSVDVATQALEKQQQARNQNVAQALGTAEEAMKAQAQLGMTQTELAIDNARRTRDGTLKELEPLKTAMPEIYAAGAAAAEASYQAQVKAAQDSVVQQLGAFDVLKANLPGLLAGIFSNLQGPMTFGNVGKQIAGGLGDSIAATLADASVGSKIATALGGVLGSTAGAGIAKGLPGLVSGLAKGDTKNAFGGFGSILGGELTKGLGTSVGKMIGGTLGSTIGSAIPVLGTMLGGMAGQMIGPLVGKVGGFVKGLFGGDSKETKEIKSIREELSKMPGGLSAVTAKAKELGIDLDAALRGKGKKGLEELKKALTELEKKQQEVDAATQKYGITWKELGAAGQARGIKEQTDTLLTDWKTLTGTMGVSSETALKKMAPALNQLLVDAQATGQKLPATMQPMIQKLHEMGLVTDETKKALLGMGGGAVVDFKAMQAAAEKYGISLDGLGDRFQSAKISDTAKTIATDLQMLVDNGADLNAVLAGSKDEIQKLVTDALRFGVELPKSMEPFVKSLMDQGGLIGLNGQALTDMSQVPFATTMGEGFATVAQKLDELMVGLGIKLPDAIAAGAGRVRDQLEATGRTARGVYDSIPDRVDTEVHTTYTSSNGGGGGGGDDSGGYNGNDGAGDYSGDQYPTYASGGIAAGKQLAIVGEAGKKEIIGDEDFMRRALKGALQSMGAHKTEKTDGAWQSMVTAMASAADAQVEKLSRLQEVLSKTQKDGADKVSDAVGELLPSIAIIQAPPQANEDTILGLIGAQLPRLVKFNENGLRTALREALGVTEAA